jgi:hypothetical protein
MRLLVSTLLLGLGSLCGALHPSLCAAAPDSKASSKPQDHPPLGIRSLEVTADGDCLHLLLGEFNGTSSDPVLTHQSSQDGGQTWSPPVVVNRNVPPPHGLHRGSDARIAAHGRHLVAAWTSTGTDKWGSGPIVTVLSEDGGQTWTPGPNPADDQRTDGHNFMALGSDPSGGFHLAWLDSRDGERGLRYSFSSDGGKTWKANATAAPKTCECCWNSLAPLEKDSIAVLYRARHPRDMRVVTSSNRGNSWSEPTAVGNFQWSLNACPHVGGALTTCPSLNDSGRRLHATVWTGATGFSGLYHLRSEDAGQTWSAPHKMNVPLAWHPHLAADARGRVVAVWDTMAAVGGEVWAAVSSDAGDSWGEPQRLTPEATPGTFPRVAPTADGFRVFWTSESPGKPATWTSLPLHP